MLASFLLSLREGIEAALIMDFQMVKVVVERVRRI